MKHIIKGIGIAFAFLVLVSLAARSCGSCGVRSHISDTTQNQ